MFLRVLLLVLLSSANFLVTAQQKMAEPAAVYIPNAGQWEGDFRYEARFGAFQTFISEGEFRLVAYKPDEVHDAHHHKSGQIGLHALFIDFPGSSSAGKFEASAAGVGTFNYFLGEKSRWRSGLQAYGKVTEAEVYPGIDLVYGSEGGQFKFDFVVAPGADPAQVRIRYRGADKLYIKNGRLHIGTSLGEFMLMAPVCWSETPFGKQPVRAQYVLDGADQLRFSFPEGYDNDYPLVLDPALVFATYSGSTSNNFGYTATPDRQGNFTTSGIVFGAGYPVTAGAFQTDFVGNTVDGNLGLNFDVAVMKLNSNGSQLVYATYLGGNRDEHPHSLNTNSRNELVVMGTTRSTNFPRTPTAYDTTFNGGYDLFLSVLSPDGSQLLGGTYLGGTQNDGLNTLAPLKYQYADDYRGDVQITENDEIIVVTVTNDPNLPTTAGVMQPAFGGGFCDGLVARFSDNLSQLRWMTYFGGSEADALYGGRVRGNQLAVVGGTLSSGLPTSNGAFQANRAGGLDGILGQMNPATGGLNFMTYLGSAGYDQLFFVDVDEFGRVYVNGQTDSNLVTFGTNYNDPRSGQYVARFSQGLDTLQWLGRYGSRSKFPDLSPSAFLVDICGNIYLSGWTGKIEGVPQPGPTNLTRTNNAIQTTSDGFDFYLAAFSQDMLTMSFATYYGGNGSQDHVDGGTSRFDPRGVMYQAICAGCGTDNFPTTPGSWSPVRGAPGVNDCNNAALKIAFELETGVRANFGWVDPPTFCAPLANLQMTDLSRSDGSTTWTWTTSDGQTSNLREPQFSFVTPGIYSINLRVQSATACNGFDTLTRYIEVRDTPPLQLPGDTCLCEEDVFTLVSNVPGTAFFWTGPEGNSTDPGYGITTTGRYILQLTDEFGCSSTDSLEIQVSECFKELPNVITPNGDGVNDALVPLTSFAPDYEMVVLNRWGQEVFRTTNPFTSWGGINQQTGRKVEGGSYLVRLKANFCGKTPLSKTFQLYVTY